MNTRGFTLVEMLMALLAFALLSSAAMALLDLTLRNKESFDRASAALQDLQVTRALMKADDDNDDHQFDQGETGFSVSGCCHELLRQSARVLS